MRQRASITDKATRSDVRAFDRIWARAELLKTPELQTRLSALAIMRHHAWSHPGTRKDRATYWTDLARLATSTDGLFESFKLHHLACNWALCEAMLAEGGWEGVLASTGYTVESGGRARHRDPQTIALALRAIRFQLAGLAVAAADEAAANEHNVDRPPCYWVTASTVGVYRKRLRDLNHRGSRRSRR